MDRPLGVQIAHMLKARGIDTVFGIPGVHNIELYRGIEAAGLRHVLARHEQGAGFMADGYARATGRPGVALVISGPGLTNIMTPMGQAYADSVPMLVISSCLDETAATRGQLHQMRDQRGAAATVCAWSEEARTAGAAYALIDRALSEFATLRPRPRHVQVPIQVLRAPAGAPPPAPVLVHPPAGAAVDVTAMLERAERPLFIFGGGARHAARDAARVIERSGALAFTTYAGRGILPPGHPQSFGAMLARPDSAAVIARADLVIAVGTSVDETDLWRTKLGHAAPLVAVNPEPDEIAALHGADHLVPQDAADFLSDLSFGLARAVPATGWDDTDVAGQRARWRAGIAAERPGIVPVADALRAALPPDTMIYSDMTQFAYAAKEVWDMAGPGLWHHPTGFGALGYALPAAIGGKIGRGGGPVAAIAGDYGLQYTMQELGTAAELGQPLPVFLWDNGKLKEIEDCMRAAQIAPVAVQARNPDFGTLAAAYGIGYSRPDGLKALARAVEAALGAAGPTLVHMTPDLGG